MDLGACFDTLWINYDEDELLTWMRNQKTELCENFDKDKDLCTMGYYHAVIVITYTTETTHDLMLELSVGEVRDRIEKLCTRIDEIEYGSNKDRLRAKLDEATEMFLFMKREKEKLKHKVNVSGFNKMNVTSKEKPKYMDWNRWYSNAMTTVGHNIEKLNDMIDGTKKKLEKEV